MSLLREVILLSIFRIAGLYVFVDHSDYYFIVFPAALDDAAEIRPVKGGVRGHAIADCADDEQPDRVAL